MIRINLLPVRQAKKRETGRQQLVLFLFLIIVECVVLFLVYSSKKQQLDTLNQDVQALQANVQQRENIQRHIGEMEDAIAALQSEQSARTNLQANRVGPGGVLDELMFMLNRPTPDDPVSLAEQQARLWNPQWDPSRVWILQLSITPTTFRLQGNALSGEDLAEFLSRLESRPEGISPFFVTPEAPRYSSADDPFYPEGVMTFTISGNVNFHPMRSETN